MTLWKPVGSIPTLPVNSVIQEADMTWTIEFWADGAWHPVPQHGSYFYINLAQTIADKRESQTSLPHRIRRVS